MGEIRIRIPDDMERAFDTAFPGANKEEAILRILRQEIARRKQEIHCSDAEKLIDDIVAFGSAAPVVTDDEIRRLREEVRG